MSTKLIATSKSGDNTYSIYNEITHYNYNDQCVFSILYSIVLNETNTLYKGITDISQAFKIMNDMVDAEKRLSETIADFNKDCTKKAMNWFNKDY